MKPLIELFIASSFWGFGFTATIWALDSLNVMALTFYRFFGAFLFGTLIWLWTKPKLQDLKSDFFLAKEAGFWLGLTLILQTWGLASTTATKSAFITVLYVVFVPLLAAVIDRHYLSKQHLICLMLALLGTYWMIDVDLSQINKGDLLTFANAFAAALQIRAMGRLAPKAKSHFNLNVFQCLWTAIFSLPIIVLLYFSPSGVHTGWSLFNLDQKVWFSLLSLTLGSSLLAFYLQVRAQNKIPASLAALLFLLESPMSAVFAAWLLHERLSSTQLAGGILIFIACWAATFNLKNFSLSSKKKLSQ